MCHLLLRRSGWFLCGGGGSNNGMRKWGVKMFTRVYEVGIICRKMLNYVVIYYKYYYLKHLGELGA